MRRGRRRATTCPRPRWCSAATRCSSSTARRSASPTTPPTPPAAGRRCAAAPACSTPGHCLRDTATGHVAAATASTRVHFADLTDDEIAAYVATGEPLHVAGAFTVDGLGGAFVAGIEGDHHTVVGVSLPLLRELLAELGHAWTEPVGRPVRDRPARCAPPADRPDLDSDRDQGARG